MVALRRMCFQVWVHRSGFDDEHWVPGYFPNGSRYWWVKCWRHWLKKRRRGAKGLVLRASVAQQIWTWGITCCVWQGMDRVFPRVFFWFLPTDMYGFFRNHMKKRIHILKSFLQKVFCSSVARRTKVFHTFRRSSTSRIIGTFTQLQRRQTCWQPYKYRDGTRWILW